MIRLACPVALLALLLAVPPVGADDPESPTFCDWLALDLELSRADHGHFYSWPTLGTLALAVGAAAPLANGSADKDVREWYQGRIHREELDGLATAFNIGGQAWVVVPLGFELAALLGHAGEDYQHDGGVFEWSNRSLRAIAVGYPPVLALYVLLGSGRPDRDVSRWQPFVDAHGASGHTFIGAIPFLTAAAMTDNPYLKVPLVAGSLLTGWSRIHDDRHYLSQVALGWCVACLSVWSIERTQQDSATWFVKPTVGPEGAGVALELRY